MKEVMLMNCMCFGSPFQPGYLQKLLPDSAPDEPEALEDILSGTFFVGH